MVHSETETRLTLHHCVKSDRKIIYIGSRKVSSRSYLFQFGLIQYLSSTETSKTKTCEDFITWLWNGENIKNMNKVNNLISS